MLNIVNLDVNGELHEIAVGAGEILTDTLRDKLGLTSVKKGCGVGECGACTVLIDGIAVNSCIYLTSWAEGKKIITVEGLRSKDNKLHPVQKAFIEEAAIQCGFCTPGFIMTAVEIAGSGKKYTRDEIRRLISGHLCRCTGYENIINAIERVIAENNIRDESVV
ncbi:xanthine dehydrogenase subunit XdhC [Cloacibacillus evryensis]|uniref:xanthine dehydrogenase subunit XdhC n=1 Tax=Cloacibacillus evryensis TaxID=508460 RepID=UPI00241F89F8|nr:xanthine dehydrogenase subunit XdhC [Cloacibacillus evryensis]